MQLYKKRMAGMVSMEDEYVCELCKREGVPKVTEHHLVPREEGGKDGEVAWLCESCHKQIHALYTNKELAVRLNTLASLENDDSIIKYLKYIRKQSASKKVKVRKSKNVRKK